jgi:hypothetical protein
MDKEFSSATKFVLYIYLFVFISFFLISIISALALIYKEKKDTQEILVYLDKTYQLESTINIRRGYYEGCSGGLAKKKDFIATVELKKCRGRPETKADLHFKEFDTKAYRFWLKYPFFIHKLILE